MVRSVTVSQRSKTVEPGRPGGGGMKRADGRLLGGSRHVRHAPRRFADHLRACPEPEQSTAVAGRPLVRFANVRDQIEHGSDAVYDHESGGAGFALVPDARAFRLGAKEVGVDGLPHLRWG